jgi:hypothetical protein
VAPSGARPTDAPADAGTNAPPNVPTVEPAIGKSEPTVQVEPPPEPKAREFKGPDGQTMYGVPNPTLDLHDALIQARKEYQALTERADESVEEMNRLLDDYDNF